MARLSDTVSRTFPELWYSTARVLFPGQGIEGISTEASSRASPEPLPLWPPSPWPRVSRSRTLPCLLFFLLVLMATQSISYLTVLKGPLPQEVRMEQIEGVKGTEHSS